MSTPLHRKPGVTVPQLQAKRLELIRKLKSEAHIASIITRDYGDHDPRIAPFPACTCGAPARLDRVDGEKWSVRCTVCDKQIHAPQKRDWAACLQWCSMNMEQLDYQTLPLFGLQGLDRDAAKVRLASIYQDLLLRSQIATLDISLSERTHQHPAPGRDYAEKLFAYRDWAKFGLQLIKVRPRGQ